MQVIVGTRVTVLGQHAHARRRVLERAVHLFAGDDDDLGPAVSGLPGILCRRAACTGQKRRHARRGEPHTLIHCAPFPRIAIRNDSQLRERRPLLRMNVNLGGAAARDCPRA